MNINNEFNEILNSRMFQNKHGKIYDKPLTILEPSIKLLDNYVTDENYRLKYTIGSINRNEDSSANIAYDKLIVEFKLNTHFTGDSYSNVCIVYDLNSKLPLFKIAAGKTLTTCLNMCVWADTDLYVTDDYKKLENRLVTYLNDLDDKEKEFELFRNTLEDTVLNKTELFKVIGKILYKSGSSVVRNATVNAIDDLQDSKSNYYIAEDNTTLWNIYNAITQQFSNKFSKTFIDVPSTTLELSKIVYS